MANTTVAFTDFTTYGVGTPWASPTAVGSLTPDRSGKNYATMVTVAGQQCDYLVCSGPTPALDGLAGATLQGIGAAVTWKSDGQAFSLTFTQKGVTGGLLILFADGQPIPGAPDDLGTLGSYSGTTDTTMTCGGLGDFWTAGGSQPPVTLTDVRKADFGVGVRFLNGGASDGTVSVNYVELTVHYLPAPASTSVIRNAVCRARVLGSALVAGIAGLLPRPGRLQTALRSWAFRLRGGKTCTVRFRPA